MKKIIKNVLPNFLFNFLVKIKNNFKKKIYNYKAYVNLAKDRNGLEVGGPSNIFRYDIPIYKNCASLEFVNFSSNTVWEGKLSTLTSYCNFKKGKQHISEASELDIFSDQQFDFVLSSNCLEHLANPIKALKEWKRVTKDFIILVLPFKDNNFDHRRPITSFDHLIDDYNSNVDEHDLTHLEEILSKHDLKLDPAAGSFEDFKKRSYKNFENRCLHHHVFDNNLVNSICLHLNMNIIEQTLTKDDWIFLIKINR